MNKTKRLDLMQLKNMSENDIDKIIRETIFTCFEIKSAMHHPINDTLTNLGFDSLDVVELTIELELIFEVTIDLASESSINVNSTLQNIVEIFVKAIQNEYSPNKNSEAGDLLPVAKPPDNWS